MQISSGILIGGKSKRMGTNKALLEMNQRTFFQTIADELNAFDELLVSVDQRETYRDLRYPLVEDEIKGIGPIEGIRQLLLHSRNEFMFICATDMPFLKKGLVDYISQFISSDYDCYVVCDTKRSHPLCAIYSKKMLDEIEEMIGAGDYKLMNLLKRVRTKYIYIEYSCYSDKMLKNVNTKDEYSRMMRPIVFCVSGVKNSGKTGLIVRLINEFIEEFPRIGVIKHDGHDFEIDHENTDTYRFTKARAQMVSIFSRNQYAILGQCETSLDDLIQFYADMDMIIIEGMKHCKYPKIEVIREGVSDECVCDQKTLIAAASDTSVRNLSKEIPVVDLNSSKEIATQIKRYFKI